MNWGWGPATDIGGITLSRCPRCAALVAYTDRDDHDQWHEGLNFALEAAARHEGEATP